jgi:uncharacterized damage-inducible protein DinB
MDMKQHLLDTFLFNNQANKKLIKKMGALPDKTDALKIMSHLVNCQYRWMSRINNAPGDNEKSWWDPVYEFNEIETQWDKSLQPWLEYFSPASDIQLDREIIFDREGLKLAVAVVDIGLQLNYHSIHHRAQIQTIIRQQGLVPEGLDYILTKVHKAGES